MTTNELDETITQALLDTGLPGNRTALYGYRIDGKHGTLDIAIKNIFDTDWLVWSTPDDYGILKTTEADKSVIDGIVNRFTANDN